MNKKSGSILLLTIIVSSIIIVFSLFMVCLVNIEYMTEVSSMRYDKMKLTAESGIERGISILKKSRGVIPVYPGNITTFSSYNNTINCTVELNYTVGKDDGIGRYTISSKALTCDGLHVKRLTAVVEDTGSFKKDFYIDNVMNNSLTVIDTIDPSRDSPISFKDNSSLNLYGTLYIQGSNVLLNNTAGTYKNILVKSNDFTTNNNSFESDRLFVDIPSEAFKTKNLDYKRVITKALFENIKPVLFKPNEKIINSQDGILIYRSDSMVKDNDLIDIQSQISTKLWQLPLNIGSVEPDIQAVLNNEQKKDLSYYINCRNYLKLVFVEGNLTINSGVYDNYLIFCTGTVTCNSISTFNNSSIFCSKINIEKDSNLTIYPFDRITLSSKINTLKDILVNNISGYYDNIEVKIVVLSDS